MKRYGDSDWFDDVFKEIANAASVYLHFYELKSDFEFIKDGGTIYYAVDSDIVFLKTSERNFESMAENYMKIFETDDKEFLHTMARITVENIFGYDFSGRICVLKPHLREILTILAFLERQNQKEFRSALEGIAEHLDSLKDFAMKMSDNPTDEELENFLAVLTKEIPILPKLFLQDNTASEISKIDDLLKQKVFNQDKEIMKPLENAELDSGFADENNWFAELKKYTPKESPDYKHVVDSRALAQTYFLTQKLKTMDDKKRFYLITGSSIIHRAVNNVRYINRNIDATLVRHPRQTTGFFRRSNQNDIDGKLKEIGDILSSLRIVFSSILDTDSEASLLENLAKLANYKVNDSKSKESIKSILKGGSLDSFSALLRVVLERIQEEWKMSMELTILSENVLLDSKKPNLEPWVKKIAEALKNDRLISLVNQYIKYSLENIEQVLGAIVSCAGETESGRTRISQDAMLASMVHGYNNNIEGRRMPCELDLGRFDIKTFIEKLQESDKSDSKGRDLIEFIEKNKNWLDLLSLAISYILATSGNWKKADIFCDIALFYSRKNQIRKISSEANFFKAVIIRHIWQESQEYSSDIEGKFELSSRYLEKAIGAYSNQTILQIKLAKAFYDNATYKYKSEQAAQIISFYNQVCFNKTNNHIAKQISDQLKNAVKILELLYNDVNKKHEIDKFLMGKQNIKIATQVLTNICGLFVLSNICETSRKTLNGTFISQNNASAALEMLRKVSKARENKVSYYVQFTEIATEWFLNDKQWQNHHKTEVLKKINDIQAKLKELNIEVFSVDRKKICLFKDLLN